MEPLIAEIEKLLDPARLEAINFASLSSFLHVNGLAHRHLSAFHKEGRVSPALFKAVKSTLASEKEKRRLSQLYAASNLRQWQRRPTTIGEDLRRRGRSGPRDKTWQVSADYFKRVVDMMREANGLSRADVRIEDAGVLLEKEVISKRNSGDYRGAILNGFVLFKWWQNRLVRRAHKPSQDEIAVATAIMSALGGAVGQAEDLNFHRDLVRLAEEIFRLDEQYPLSLRSLMDMRAGWLENDHPDDLSVMRRTLDIYRDEAEVTTEVIRHPQIAVHFSEAFWGLTGTYFNRANTALRTDTPPAVLVSLLSELQDRSAEVGQILSTTEAFDGKAAPYREASLFHRILHVRLYDKLGQPERALACAAELLAEADELPAQLFFLRGNLHVLLGTLKMRERTRRCTTALDQEIFEHQSAAIHCFERVGNFRMLRKARYILRLGGLSGRN